MNKFVHCKNTIFLNNRFRNSNRLKKYAKFQILIIYFLKIFQILTFCGCDNKVSISVFEQHRNLCMTRLVPQKSRT